MASGNVRVCVVMLLLPLLLLLLVAPSLETAEAASVLQPPRLRIGAFNIRNFGTSMSNPAKAPRIKEIVQRYDVLLVQEIRDRSQASIRQLMEMLAGPYRVVLSMPLGSTRYKEQYAYIYRSDKVSPIGFYQYEDRGFERPPMVFQLTAQHSPRDKALTLIGLHVKPSHAIFEIGRLRGVIATILEQLGPDSEPVILGDLNADCSYANLQKRRDANDYLTMNTNTYEWLIGEEADTTTSANNRCAYDRIIVRKSLLPRVVPESAKVFNFRTRLGLSQHEAYGISDHFPVEMTVQF